MAAAGEPGQDGALFDAVKAVGLELCPELGIAIPVGKDSLSMKTVWRDDSGEHRMLAPVSLIVSAFAPVEDVSRSLTPQLDTNCGDSRLLLITDQRDPELAVRFGGKSRKKSGDKIKAAEFIAVKGITARGKRVSPHPVVSVSEETGMEAHDYAQKALFDSEKE